jgi:hypothetical protein
MECDPNRDLGYSRLLKWYKYNESDGVWKAT